MCGEEHGRCPGFAVFFTPREYGPHSSTGINLLLYYFSGVLEETPLRGFSPATD